MTLLTFKKFFLAEIPSVKSVPCHKTSLSRTFSKCFEIIFLQKELIEYSGLSEAGDSDEAMEGSLYSKDGNEITGSHVSISKKDGEADLITMDTYVNQVYYTVAGEEGIFTTLRV